MFSNVISLILRDSDNRFRNSQFDTAFCIRWPENMQCKGCIMNTLKCLSIGTPKTINFPFVSNGELMVFRCLNIQAHHNEAVIYLNFGTPTNNGFSIWNKWKI